MKSKTVADGQTLIDIAIQELGDVGRLFDLANLNGLAITDDIEVSITLELPGLETGKGNIIKLFNDPANRPASAITNVLQEPEGIEYWRIEFEFIVS